MPGPSSIKPVEGHSRNLFWTLTQIQDKLVWALADTGSTANLISNKFYNTLLIKPKIKPPGNIRIIAGNGQPLKLLGYITLCFAPAGVPVYHEVAVVEDLDLDFVIGSTFMRFHSVFLKYEPQGRQTFDINKISCETCIKNLEYLKSFNSKQLSPSFSTPKFSASIGECNGHRQWMLMGVPTPQPLIVGVGRDEAGAARHSKLVKVLDELKISEMDISDERKHKLVEIVDECLDAFAADDDEVGQTDLVSHKINTQDNPPFQQKLRQVPDALRVWLKSEIDRLLKTNVIESAQPGECPYASPIVIFRKIDSR